jgi:hypothetical protein
MNSVRTDGDAFFVVLKGEATGDFIGVLWHDALAGDELCRPAVCVQRPHRSGHQAIHDHASGNDSLHQSILLLSAAVALSDSRILWRGSGSAIGARLASGKSQGRSSQINFLHATEVDYSDNITAGCWQKFKTGRLPSMEVQGAIAILESTCQGKKGVLRSIYTIAGPTLEVEAHVLLLVRQSGIHHRR